VIAVLVLGAIAFVCAGLALQYTWLFFSGLRKRHAAHFERVKLFGKSEAVLALNDADLYASWRLARVNLVVSVGTMCAAIAVAMLVMRSR
jgi:hypothetical protein